MTAFRACGGDVFWLGRHYLPPEQTRTLLELLWSEAGACAVMGRPLAFEKASGLADELALAVANAARWTQASKGASQ